MNSNRFPPLIWILSCKKCSMHCTGRNNGRIQEVKHEVITHFFFFLDKSLHTFLKTLRNNKFYATSKGNCPELKKILYPTSQWKMDPSKLPLTKYSSWNGCQAKADNWKQKCNISINVSKITSFSFFGGWGGVCRNLCHANYARNALA